MIFWIFAAILTLAASIAVMYPFLKRQQSPTELGYDVMVYKDQLRELDRDVDRGLISAEDAVEARAEIGRRILRTNSDDEANSGHVPLTKAPRIIAIIAVLSVPLLSWGLYVTLGEPDLPAMPLAQRTNVDPAQASIQELIERAEKHLVSAPDDAKGWEVLAPVYMRMGRYQDAAHAYRRLNAIKGPQVENIALLGEALVGASGGIVSSDAEAVFIQALELDKANPRAQFFLGLARAQEGDNERAKQLWGKMIAELPSGSPWRDIAQEALQGSLLQRSESTVQNDVPDATNPVSPTDAEVDAEMIEGMVQSLAARLANEPNNPEGWRMLVRSFVVLGQMDQAEKALEQGYKALGADIEAATGLMVFAKELGVIRREVTE